MNKRRFLIIEDVPQTAQNISNILSKELLATSSSFSEITIDIAYTLGQAADFLSRSTYDGIISDFIVLPKEEVRKRLLKEGERLQVGEITAESHLISRRLKQITWELDQLDYFHKIPEFQLKLSPDSKFIPLLNEWHTGAIIRYIKYNYSKTPLLICTGTTFEKEAIMKTLGIKEKDLKTIFEIRFIDKPLFNLNPELLAPELNLQRFIDLFLKNMKDGVEGELAPRTDTSDVTIHTLFNHLIINLKEQQIRDNNSENNECRVE